MVIRTVSPFDGEYSSEFDPTSENLLALRHPVQDSLSPEDLESIKAHYDRGIRFTDQQLRRLFEALEETAFLDNAVVLLTSDHGEEFGEHGRVLHFATLFDELLHVPMVLLAPDGPVGIVNHDLVSTLDIAPTLLSLAAVPTPESMQGHSLLDPSVERRAVFSQFGDAIYSVRTDRWKLIRWRNQRLNLYDLHHDPGELLDVSRENPEVVRDLRNQLENWKRSQPAPISETSEGPQLDEEEEERLRNLGYL